MAEQQQTETFIKCTCVAIGRYYQSLGKPYNDEFSEYCDDNGYDDEEAVRQEMEQDPTDCAICDFDDNFPFEDEPKDKETKAKFIYNVVKKCINYPHTTFKSNIPQLTKDDFVWNEKDLESVFNIYAEQCPAFVDTDFEHDNGLLTMLGIGNKYKFDYMLHLMDDYNRWYINNLDNKDIKGAQSKHNAWVATCPHLKQLVALNPKYQEIATTAVHSFNKRICTSLQFEAMKKIDDSLERISCHIRNASVFIWNLLNGKHNLAKFDDRGLCPFQYDFCIATGKPLRDEISDNKEDDDDDDSKDEFKDYIGNIEQKLIHNNLKYSKREYHEVDDTKETRVLSELYKSFLDNHQLRDKSAFNYLHKKRLITLLDRRISKDDEAQNDDIYMYEAPENCRFIPTDAVAEWYINSSATYLVPPDLGATHHFKGGLLTLSFHVKQENEIKCYLFWNGQMIRFMPNDIKTVLPNIMNMKREDNKNFINNKKELDLLIEEMQKSFFDEGFMEFRNQQ